MSLALLLLLAFAAGADAAEPFGAISGTVTDSSTHDPIAGLEVCAFSTHIELLGEEKSEYEHAEGCAKTNGEGNYEIAGLQAESFFVVFGDPFEEQSGYIEQFYAGKANGSEANEVAVLGGKRTAGIDAELVKGGEIAGVLTSSATGAPIEKALACAIRVTPAGTLEAAGCAISEADGDYTIRGLASAGYKVGFIASGYGLQYYDGVSTAAEAQTVSVTAPEVTSGIDASMTPGPLVPPSPGAPGQSQPGSPSSLPQPGARPSLGASAVVSLVGAHRARVRNGRALVELACAGAHSCAAKLTLRLTRTVTIDGRRTRRTVTIGRSRVLTLAPSASRLASVQLDPSARRLLRQSHGRLEVEIVVQSTAGAHDASLTLVQAA